jgi:hypothetical protein
MRRLVARRNIAIPSRTAAKQVKAERSLGKVRGRHLPQHTGGSVDEPEAELAFPSPAGRGEVNSL